MEDVPLSSPHCTRYSALNVRVISGDAVTVADGGTSKQTALDTQDEHDTHRHELLRNTGDAFFLVFRMLDHFVQTSTTRGHAFTGEVARNTVPIS